MIIPNDDNTEKWNIGDIIPGRIGDRNVKLKVINKDYDWVELQIIEENDEPSTNQKEV